MEDQHEKNLLENFKSAMAQNLAAGLAKIQKHLDDQNNTPLNIAITGESGAGKSSFVNAFRGLKNSDEGASPTGCVETTIEVKGYPHKNYPNVVLWDLPGVGTTKFPADKYLEQVEFEKYDFFIILSATRFRENDVKLAQEIQKIKKKFYFVRSKIDGDLYNEEQCQREFNREKTLSLIRENCIQGLRELRFEAPQVFLVSSFRLHLFDFRLLEETFEKELIPQKRHVLLLVTPIISPEIIEKKKKTLMSQIKFQAALSSVAAAVTVPGLSVAVDVGMMVRVVTRYVFAFHLDKKSLERLAAIAGVPYDRLLDVTTSQLAATEITPDLLKKVLSSFTVQKALIAEEEGAKFIPIIGLPVARCISFTSTYSILKTILNMIADDAQKVLKRLWK